nr:hypothetical protein [uncultured Hyphomonas sp.]
MQLLRGRGLFFAIMVPDSAWPEIATCFGKCRRDSHLVAQPIAADRLHLSLSVLYVGEVLPSAIIELASLTGGAVRFVEFDLVFDRALSFRNKRRAKPFVLVASDESAAIVRNLSREIERTLSMLSGAPARPVSTSTPHVTLA